MSTRQEEVERVVVDLFESKYSFLVAYATRSTGSLHVAEDLVQETLLELCEALLRGVKIRTPGGWALTAVRHKIAKHFRAVKTGPFICNLPDGEDSYPDPDSQMYDLSDQDVETDELWELFSVLTRREEEIVLLRLEGLKYAEIAGHLGIGVPTVKTLIGRGIRKLREARSSLKTNPMYVETIRQTLER